MYLLILSCSTILQAYETQFVLSTKNLDSKKVSFYLKPGNASDQRHLVTGV